MTMKDILELLSKKYPETEDNCPALLIYDDESGRIVRDAVSDCYSSSNCLYAFDNIDELVAHLQGEIE